MQSSNNNNNITVTKKKDLAADLRAKFNTVSAPIDSKVYVQKLEDWVNNAYENGIITLEHLMAVVRYFKVFNMSSKEAAVETLEEGLKKADAASRERFAKSKPTVEKKNALILIKELIDATKNLDPRTKTAANWARLPILAAEAAATFDSMQLYVVPERRALIMTKFMWNALNYEFCKNNLVARYSLAFNVLKTIKASMGGLVKIEAKSSVGTVIVESTHYTAPGLVAAIKAQGVAINSPGIKEEKWDALMGEDKKSFSLNTKNIQLAIAGCVLPSATHLLMAKDYRIAKSPSGTPGNKANDPALITKVKADVAGLMLAVIKFFDPSFSTKDVDLDPKKNGQLRVKYWEAYRMLTTTIRQLNYTLYGKRGGANTRDDMKPTELSDFSSAFGSL